MPADHTHHKAAASLLIITAGILAMAGGGMVLAGWLFDLTTLKSIVPAWVSMKPNTAVAFILTGAAVLLSFLKIPACWPAYRTFFSRLARFFSLAVGLIGLLTLIEYVFNLDFGIDHWLFREPPGTPGTSHPGRMAPETALCYMLLAAALFIFNPLHKTPRTVLVSITIGLLVVALALSALLSYFTPGFGAHGWFGLTIMAVHTAILFTLLGLAVIAMNWQPEVLSWSLTGRTTAAFACVMALLVFIGLNASRSHSWVLQISYRTMHGEKAMDGFRDVIFKLAEAQANTRGYVITGDSRLLKSYLSARADSTMKMESLRRLVADNPRQLQQFAIFETQVNEALQWFQQGIELGRAGISAEMRRDRVIHGEKLMGKIYETFAQIESSHHKQADQLRQESEYVVRFSYFSISTGTLVSLFIFIVVMAELNSAIIARKRAEEQIRQLALHDTLTKLANRRLLIDRLEQAMAVSGRSGRYGAVLFMDLDNFKPLNDRYGHYAGDLLLVEAARRIAG